MSWSSGKDSTLALHVARHELDVDVSTLLVTVNAEADRVAMHAVRRSLLQAQAERLGVPLHVVEIPSPCPNDVYEARMATAMAEAKATGVERVIFGDLFLADIRAYREQALAGSGIEPLFPLWQRPTTALARDMLAAGIRAVLTCVDPKQVAPEFAGRQFDEALLEDLPKSVDPCGENGEFHTFVYDGPGFSSPIDIEVGEVVERGGFVFCDVRPV
ncbi:MAG: adenine nucleotide alpha hydrolase [Acidimicrobiia bacterium]|nr:adenine nucleotide alpha hydrolase [Acidimicrobiia bacterium]